MNLYLDDDSAKAAPRHPPPSCWASSQIPSDVSLSGAADPRHLHHAVLLNFILVTRNHDDFEDLHQLVQAVQGRHAGIVAVRFDNDPSRDMKDADIVRAIRNIEQAGVPIANEFHILNHWR